ncbi:phospholipid carrier-dependent glycosyltransferase [Candidatus Gottesmanbacteria bacterium]|nr:phospholipid carrier-dependent glycosyltransferase [Candidatus Gottesmanbacteria bacterium]
MKHTILLILIFAAGFLVRIYHVNDNPPSLYWDEASLGYNAYTIATSLKDEHGEFLPVARFTAFGDYKPPGYIYSIVPFIWFFDLNELSTRLPSILAGTGMVILTFFLVQELFSSFPISALSSFFVAISPWSILLSRAAFEANLAAFFNLCGLFLFIKSMKRKSLLLLSFIFFVFSFYTFNANRIIAPLFIMGLIFLYYRQILLNLRWLFVAVFISFFLLLPSFSFLQSKESKVRFQEVTIFTNLVPVETANRLIVADNDSLIAKIIHNRRILYFLEFLRHYTDHFEGRFLFSRGDENLRLSIQDMGELYPFDLILILLGIYALWTGWKKEGLLLLFWALIVPIPAALARETPHALRTVSILPVYQILGALGTWFVFRHIHQRSRLFGILCVTTIIFFQIFYFTHEYFIHYKVQYGGAWQYGYKQMVEYVLANESKYENIFVTDALGRPYIFFAFYGKLPVDKLLRERVAQPDIFGLWNVFSMGKIHMTTNGIENASGKTLAVTRAGYLPMGFSKVAQIDDLSANGVFDIGEK